MNLLLLITIKVVSVSTGRILTTDERSDGVQHQIVRRRADQQAAAYPSSSAPASESVDLHNKEFCVDVSTYQPVVWVESDGEECHTLFVKKCEDKQENVCADVTETRCEVKLY